MWLEFGNNTFTTAPVTDYLIRGTQSHVPLLMTTRLYDTTKDRLNLPTQITSQQMERLSEEETIVATKILGNNAVKITPNAFDVVPGDPMAFAITYRTPDEGPVEGEGGYKLYFLYNNNRTFDAITNTANNTITAGGTEFEACRRHNAELITYNTPGISSSINRNGSLNWVCFSITKPAYFEKTVFVSLKPFEDLELGKSGSVYAVLTKSNGEFIAADSITNMRFSPAHDPNYLVQQPYCLLLEKKVYPFNYTVHFQNEGGGNASEVKVVVQVPEGMNFGTLRVTKAVFAGVNYLNNVQVLKKEAENQVVFIFKSDAIPGRKTELLGTASCLQPATDMRTMGDIQFTLNSTPNTSTELESHADIYFRSVHPSNDITSDGYEQAVQTNKGLTKYKKSCVCRDCPEPDSCFKLLGLCWWWWIIILAALLLAAWFIIAWRRKKKREEEV
jgi:hypothetical protein